jgi:salicylate synthetase
MDSLCELSLPACPAPHVLATALMQGGLLSGDFFLYASEDTVRLASNWLASVTVSADSVTLECDGQVIHTEAARDPLGQAGRLLASISERPWTAYGYLAFDLARFYYPSYAWSFPGALLRLCVPRLEVICRKGRLEARGLSDPQRIPGLLDAAAAVASPAATAVSVPADDRGAFCNGVADLVAAIRAGRLQKAILSRRCRVTGQLDLLKTHAAAGRANRSPRSFCFQMGPVGACGYSPEILLESDGDGCIVTNPLAGTRGRGASPEEDARLAAELYMDAKEVKEHALSVIHAQDELRTVCRRETVQVRDFMAVKKLNCVQHLSSLVSGQLATGRNCWDAIRAVFPAITVSGIPKADALHFISTLEGEPRGLYGGAVGWVDDSGRVDLALAIRSLFQYGDSFQLASGAGIIAESQPEREYVESVMKMNTMAAQVVLRPS